MPFTFTKLHLLLLLLILGAGAAGFWYYKDTKKLQTPVKQTPVASPPPQEPAAQEALEPVKSEEKKFLANQAIAVAGEHMKMGRQESKDMTGPESTLRRAKELFALSDYNQAYELAHQAILEFAQAPLKERVYTVRHGDSLWNIAKKSEHYGRGAKWVKIWRANEPQIPDFDLIEVGQKLKLPQ